MTLQTLYAPRDIVPIIYQGQDASLLITDVTLAVHGSDEVIVTYKGIARVTLLRTDGSYIETDRVWTGMEGDIL